MPRTLLISLLLIALLPGCPARQKCVLPEPAAAVKPAKPAPPAQESLLNHVPHAATLALVIRENGLRMVTSLYAEDAAMKAELSTFMKRVLGVDFTTLKGVVVWATGLGDKAAAGIFIRLKDATTPKGAAKGEYKGVKLVGFSGDVLGAALPGGVMIGSEAGVKLAIDLAQGAATAMGKESALAGAAAMGDYPGVDLLLLGSVLALDGADAQARAMATQFGIAAGSFSWDHELKLKAMLVGDPDKLAQLKKMITAVLGVQVAKLKATKDTAKQGEEAMKGVSSIMGYHLLNRVISEAEPKLEENRLVAGYSFPSMDSTQLFTGYVGILAAVAIPAFIKYIRKSKTVEATEALDRLKLGAKVYYQADHYSKRGKLQPKRFPPSEAKWWPPVPCCKQPDKKCSAVGGSAWDQSPWRALHFKMDSPHYYQYRFISAGKGKGATFIAEALGDLDCDGEYSNFKIKGHIDSAGSVVTVGPIIENEIE